ncbi:MAG: DUF3598 family protein [Saprospiraceae bacterium]|nr:DUF3598 family protein [Saprospiraceae bacterium]
MTLRLFPLHLGIWEGTYTRIQPDGTVSNTFRSRLTIRMPDDRTYQQVNEYFWDDGHYECHDFGTTYFNEQGELIFDNPRMVGKAWETQNSVVLTWSYRDRPDSQLYELINLIGDNKHRIRVWKWSCGDVFEGLTMIDERKVGEVSDIPDSFWTELPNKRFKGVSRSNL